MSASAKTEKPPSAWHIHRVLSQTRETLDDLINNHGLVLSSDDDILEALDAEQVDVRRVLRSLGISLVEAKAMGAMIKTRMDDMTIRRKRSKTQEEKIRPLTLLLMEEADLTTFQDAEFSLTRSKGQRKVHILDVEDLDDDLVEVEVVINKKPKLDLIRKRLEAGETVKSATLGNREPVLTLRTK